MLPMHFSPKLTLFPEHVVISWKLQLLFKSTVNILCNNIGLVIAVLQQNTGDQEYGYGVMDARFPHLVSEN